MSVFPKSPVRYLITRGDLTEQNFHQAKHETLSTVRLALERGIELIQIREKQLEARSVFELAQEAVRIGSGGDTRILVNERFDIAFAAKAHGVHLTSRSIPVETVRRIVPPGFLVGVSAHSKNQVIDAKSSGTDFALLGNVFATPGKREPIGLARLAEICAAAEGFPVLAVGGVDAENHLSVIEAGALGFAAIRYLNEFVNIGE